MGLMAWSAPTAKIELPGGGDFSVRGLCLRDVTGLWSIFGEELFNIFSGLTEMGDGSEEGKQILAEASLMAWMGKIVVDFPDIVCNVIAIASDESESMEAVSAQVANLPITIQVEALLGIYRMTVEEAGGSKKFVQHLATLFQVANNMMASRAERGSIGIGDSENVPAS